MTPPYFWSAGLDPQSRESAPLARLLLTPFAALYAYLGARRIASATPEKVPIPVICIGNVTVGGSGKTPIVQAIRALLQAQGLQAASLSRGYGGQLNGPLEVTPTDHTAQDVGDEPLMLSNSGKSWISADRAAGAHAMIASGIDIIIMDDGHQNQDLRKDISFLVLDSGAPFGNGHIIPKGPLREPIAASLKRAEAIILMGDGPIPQIVQLRKLPLFRAALQQTEPLPEGPLFAFAGIGRPARFFNALRAAGGDLKDAMSFGDHHVYKPHELDRLHRLADSHKAQLVTTEKDYIRLSPAQRQGILPIRVRAVFEDEAALLRLLMTPFEGLPK